MDSPYFQDVTTTTPYGTTMPMGPGQYATLETASAVAQKVADRLKLSVSLVDINGIAMSTNRPRYEVMLPKGFVFNAGILFRVMDHPDFTELEKYRDASVPINLALYIPIETFSPAA